MRQIKLVLTDDHKMVREAMALMFNGDERFKVLAQCESGDQAVTMARVYSPDIMLMDINMPGLNGFEASEQIKKASPGVKILAVSMNSGTHLVKRMMKAGVMGYITKSSTSDELKKAVLEINDDRKYICAEIKNLLSAEFLETGLPDSQSKEPSKRELQVLCKVAEGLTSAEIAEQLELSVKTIEVHRYNIRKKLNLKSISAMINYVNDNGLIA